MSNTRMIACALAAANVFFIGGQVTARPEVTLTTLYSFGGGSDGAESASLIADASGNLYGTTTSGGTGSGTVFMLTPPTMSGRPWTETVLYTFAGGSDGANPIVGLIADTSGNLYGTTTSGGSTGNGTVFKLTPPTTSGGPWSETVIWSFTASDGAQPFAGLIADVSGNLYGTTYAGGLPFVDGLRPNWGKVFRLTPPTTSGGPWTETVLYTFAGGSDGANPLGGLIADASGNLYGTTLFGGTGKGTVFKLTPPTTSGGPWTETVLYTFTGPPDGANPRGNLMFDVAGDLYGTTLWGGTGNGTVFKLTPPTTSGRPWTETLLYTFAGGSDGGQPFGGLIADGSGNLYGTTSGVGRYGTVSTSNGTVFKLTPPTTNGGPWTETVLWSFTSGSDGGYPEGGLIAADASDELYGTTLWGGAGYGTVFRLTLPATFIGVPGRANCHR
jgi:uncharacterized repeat protein (TIGR03803 family)